MLVFGSVTGFHRFITHLVNGGMFGLTTHHQQTIYCATSWWKKTPTPPKANMCVFPKIGVPQNGWFIRKTLLKFKIDDLGVPLFLETPMYNQTKVEICKMTISFHFGMISQVFRDTSYLKKQIPKSHCHFRGVGRYIPKFYGEMSGITWYNCRFPQNGASNDIPPGEPSFARPVELKSQHLEKLETIRSLKPPDLVSWVFPKIGVGLPNHQFYRVFPYKPSILGYHYFWMVYKGKTI